MPEYWKSWISENSMLEQKTNHEHWIIQHQNDEHYETLIIQWQNHENHENLIIQFQNHENH